MRECPTLIGSAPARMHQTYSKPTLSNPIPSATTDGALASSATAGRAALLMLCTPNKNQVSAVDRALRPNRGATDIQEYSSVDRALP